MCKRFKCKQSNIHLFQWCEAFQWYEGRGGGGDNLVPRRDPGNEVGEVIAGKTV